MGDERHSPQQVDHSWLDIYILAWRDGADNAGSIQLPVADVPHRRRLLRSTNDQRRNSGWRWRRWRNERRGVCLTKRAVFNDRRPGDWRFGYDEQQRIHDLDTRDVLPRVT